MRSVKKFIASAKFLFSTVDPNGVPLLFDSPVPVVSLVRGTSTTMYAPAGCWICGDLLNLLANGKTLAVRERAATLFGRAVSHVASKKAIEVSKGLEFLLDDLRGVHTVLRVLCNESSFESAGICRALCSALAIFCRVPLGRLHLLAHKISCGNDFLKGAAKLPHPSFALLSKLIRSKDPKTAGNAALVVAGCALESRKEHKQKVLKELGSAVILPLVELMRKGSDMGVGGRAAAKNAAIAAARLAQFDANRSALRSMRAIELMMRVGSDR